MNVSNPELYLKIGDQDEFNIEDKVQGLTFLGDDSTPALANTYQEIPGLDGSKLQYTTFSRYQVVANFCIYFTDWEDYKLAKHQFYRLFTSRQLIRMRTDVESAIVRFVYPNLPEIKPDQNGSHFATFSMNFDNPSGFRYSLYRSDGTYSNDLDGVQFGMNLHMNDDQYNYHFTTNQFKVYNASDIQVDPFGQKHDLKIISKFKGNSMKITNNTNGSEWSYTKASNGEENIVLDGINTTLNGNPASTNTDYGNIILDTGWNDIAVTGADSVDITFSFPFIYL
ncbi:phage tail domain-containing protein [Limosilactobacillus reuteri]|uniref:phage tail domain-containing protein n=1 Tax=Limosilactobacillus reuteri TaxID=1598 RepID=UPI000A2D25C0|nr:phage tail domain-containing protein [Limosilactobacillus reuteri]OTA48252.1 phage tail protein [Limosilactobacillus reuteri]